MRGVRRLTIWSAALIVAVLGWTPAQSARLGVIKGRVINAALGQPQAGVRITLTGANQDGSQREKTSVRTDRNGRYEFADLTTGEERFYAIDAYYSGGFFAGRPLSLPSDTTRPPVVTTTLRVWETTREPAAVLITRDDMFVVLDDRGLGIVESVRIVNQTDKAYIGRARAMTQRAPSFGFSLPVDCNQAAVAIRDATLDVPHIVCTDFGFGIRNALPPGETRMTFSYRVLGDTATFDLSRSALYDVTEMSIFMAEPLTIESNRLKEGEGVTLAGTRYRRWTNDSPLQPGDPIQVGVTAQAQISVGLAAGIGAAVLLIGVLALGAIRRARRPVEVSLKPRASNGDDRRDELVEAIAALDVAYQQGRLSEEEWTSQRTRLKNRLAGQGEGQ